MNSVTINNNASALDNLKQISEMLGKQQEGAKIYGKKNRDGEITLYVKTADTTGTGKAKKFFENLFRVSANRRQVAQGTIQGLVSTLSTEVHRNDKLAESLKTFSESSLLHGHNRDTSKAHRVGDLSKMLNSTINIYEKASLKELPNAPQYKPQAGKEVSKLGLTHIDWKPGNSIEIDGFTAKPFTLKGITYEPVKHLATGGFGHVFQYQSNETPPKTVAFKVTIPQATKEDTDRVRLAATVEIKNHRQIAEKSPNSVVGFVGACCLPSGEVGILTDFAPHGDIDSMARNIQSRIVEDGKEPGPGQLTRTQANAVLVTLVKDMATGLVSMHDHAGMTHLDFKPANMLIGSDGVGRMADFGTSFEGTTGRRDTMAQIDTPAYKAPELLHGDQREVDGKKLALQPILQENRLIRSQISDDLKVLFPNKEDHKVLTGNDNDKNQDSLAGDIFFDKAKQRELLSNIEVSARPEIKQVRFDNTFKMDIWGLGASAYQMFTNKPIGSDTFSTVAGERSAKFFDNREGLAIAKEGQNFTEVGALAPSTKDMVLDDFLNFILASKPEDRPTAKQILDHPIFKNNAVDSPEARVIMVGIAKNDPEIIDFGRKGLKL